MYVCIHVRTGGKGKCVDSLRLNPTLFCLDDARGRAGRCWVAGPPGCICVALRLPAGWMGEWVEGMERGCVLGWEGMGCDRCVMHAPASGLKVDGECWDGGGASGGGSTGKHAERTVVEPELYIWTEVEMHGGRAGPLRCAALRCAWMILCPRRHRVKKRTVYSHGTFSLLGGMGIVFLV